MAKTVGADSALRAYEALLAATLQELAPGKGAFEPEIWVDGDLDAFAGWQRQSGVSLGFPLVAQDGGDLGERMFRTFDDGVRVLVGTDIPDLTANYVESALVALRTCDLVLGPTEDGGYCLIGMNSPRPELFDGIRWGSADVLTSTLGATGGLRVKLLDALWDVDSAGDLVRWRAITRVE